MAITHLVRVEPHFRLFVFWPAILRMLRREYVLGKTMHLAVTGFTVLICLGLNSCTSGTNPETYGSVQNFSAIEANHEAVVAAQEKAYPNYPKIGQTYLSYSPLGHGYQVTYIADRQTSWLWYGGNPVALPAKWKVIERDVNENGQKLTGRFRTQICYTYGANTYNPATKHKGGSQECTLLVNVRNMTVGALKGDVFGLANGTVPYVRQKCDAPDKFVLPAQHPLGAALKDCATNPR